MPIIPHTIPKAAGGAGSGSVIDKILDVEPFDDKFYVCAHATDGISGLNTAIMTVIAVVNA